MMETIENLLNKLETFSDIQPEDTAHFEQLNHLLDQLGKIENIRYLLNHYSDDLLAYCEEYDFLTKIALYHTKNQALRLRIHLFLPGYSNRIHHHRWNYCAKILKGEYTQSLYGKKNDFDLNHLDIPSIRPDVIMTVKQGDSYYLQHEYVHSVKAKENTVSLFLRGPAVDDKFWIIDQKAGTFWWQYGAKQETYEEKKSKAMSLETLQKTKEQLIKLLQGENHD